MKDNGLRRQPRVRHRNPLRTELSATSCEEREVRSYESEYVNALWHTDFHHGSLPVLTSKGAWQKPIAFGALDDCSRMGLHVQWYLSETTRAYVHGLGQGFQKYGLPRSKMSDNGSAMTAAETVEGLTRLGIVHVTTRPRSPWQSSRAGCWPCSRDAGI
jgi:transposase InsO family protein